MFEMGRKFKSVDRVELFQAYEEQKYLYLKESVLENMEDCLPKRCIAN